MSLQVVHTSVARSRAKGEAMSSKIGKVGSIVFASIAGLLGEATPAVAADKAPAASASVCSDAGPPATAAPAGQELAFELLAEGVQVYACVPGAAPGVPAWAFQAPEATLSDRRGEYAGSHGAGPTWKALDGSSVVGAKVESATPDPAAIPWLLLRAASHGGERGRMADVTFVQRRDTSGGTAPSEGCSAGTVGAVARVPYRAVYCFYRSHGTRPEGESTTQTLSRGAPRP
jgi:hypothetical protein